MHFSHTIHKLRHRNRKQKVLKASLGRIDPTMTCRMPSKPTSHQQLEVSNCYLSPFPTLKRKKQRKSIYTPCANSVTNGLWHCFHSSAWTKIHDGRNQSYLLLELYTLRTNLLVSISKPRMMVVRQGLFASTIA